MLLEIGSEVCYDNVEKCESGWFWVIRLTALSCRDISYSRAELLYNVFVVLYVPFKSREAGAILVSPRRASSIVSAKGGLVIIVVTDSRTLDFAMTAVKKIQILC